MAALLICAFLITLQTVLCNEPSYNNEPSYKKEGIMDHLNNGMKFAKDFLGSDSIALKVAEFVVRAFQPVKNGGTVKKHPLPHHPDVDNNPEGAGDNLFEENKYNNVHDASNPMSPLKHLVRLFGLQPSQISAVAVNALVFVAQMISSFLSGPNVPNKPRRSGDPVNWILNKNSKTLQNLITTAKNESLTEIIQDVIKQRGPEEETSCIRLLVCKISPFVVKMQEAVFGKEPEELRNKKEIQRGAAVMYKHLPSADEINRKSDVCEKRHIDCNLDE